jgi:CDP-2,3-bis-(O-geranylgeranyl)-sn-glycerol synthase
MIGWFYELIQVFWILIPAIFANLSPVLVKKVDFLNYPVDFYRKLGNKRLFGENKTYRGFFFGILAAILIAYIQMKTTPYLFVDFIFDYGSINIIAFGALLGFGALFGDLVKSFVKRRIGKKEGQSWLPFDQIDWAVMSLIFLNLMINISLLTNILVLVIGGVGHAAFNYVGYLMNLKKSKF